MKALCKQNKPMLSDFRLQTSEFHNLTVFQFQIWHTNWKRNWKVSPKTNVRVTCEVKCLVDILFSLNSLKFPTKFGFLLCLFSLATETAILGLEKNKIRCPKNGLEASQTCSLKVIGGGENAKTAPAAIFPFFHTKRA